MFLEARLNSEQMRNPAVVGHVLVNVVGKHPQRGFQQHPRDRPQVLLAIDRASRVAGRIQDDAAAFGRQRVAQVLRGQPKALFFARRHQLGLGAGQPHHLGKAHPGRGGNDHLVAFIEKRGDSVEGALLASRRSHHLGRLVIEPIVALEFEAKRLFEFAGTAGGSVLGLARGHGFARRFLDSLRGVEVGLAGRQRYHIDSSFLEFRSARLGGHRGGRPQCSHSAVELDHGWFLYFPWGVFIRCATGPRGNCAHFTDIASGRPTRAAASLTARERSSRPRLSQSNFSFSRNLCITGAGTRAGSRCP